MNSSLISHGGKRKKSITSVTTSDDSIERHLERILTENGLDGFSQVYIIISLLPICCIRHYVYGELFQTVTASLHFVTSSRKIIQAATMTKTCTVFLSELTDMWQLLQNTVSILCLSFQFFPLLDVMDIHVHKTGKPIIQEKQRKRQKQTHTKKGPR